MDLRNSVLVVCFAGCLGLVIFSASLAGFWLFPAPQPQIARPPARPPMPMRDARRSGNPGMLTDLAEARVRVLELQAMLNESENSLAERNRELRREQAAKAELERELNRTMNLTLELVGDERRRPVDSKPPADSTTPVEAPEAADPPENPEIARLQQLLMEREQEIEELEFAAGRDAARLLEDTLSFRDAVAQIVARIGPTSADSLQGGLTHRQPAVREWCAMMIGRLGPDAVDAAADLRTLASADADERVREAARRALLQIMD